MRLVFAIISTVSVVTGCSMASTSSSPYKQPDGSSTASVRFRVASISREVNLGAVLLYNYADDQCGPSAHGRYIDEIGTNKTFVSRSNQSIGMPKPQNYPAYTYVERRFVSGRPLVFSVVAASGGPQHICQTTHRFLPSPGKMYEVTIDVLGLQDCPVQVTKLHFVDDKVFASKESTAQQLPKFCKSPSIFN